MDIRFHCAQKLRRVMVRCRHDLETTCDPIRKVLKNNPDYGPPVDRFSKLRKMRVHVPALNVGKSGGYRLIYRLRRMDQTMHVALLTVYYKGDVADLNDAEYKELEKLSETILSSPLSYEWTDE